ATEEEWARIITTPRTNEAVPTAASIGADGYSTADDTAAANGQSGLTAGPITVNVNALYTSDMDEMEPAVRFVLTGGQGQQPGTGA
ncbi:unnamed protein product, partial [marine sediment metagenome]